MSNTFQSILKACAALIVLVSATPALSQYVAQADSSATTSWARKATQNAANQAALDACNKVTPNKNCKIREPLVALVGARGEGRVGFGASSKSIADARAKALEHCAAPDCKVRTEFTEPGFIAMARTKNAESEPHFFITHGYDNADLAEREAIKGSLS